MASISYRNCDNTEHLDIEIVPCTETIKLMRASRMCALQRAVIETNDAIHNSAATGADNTCVDWKFLPPDLRDTLIAAYTVRGYAVMPDGLDSNDIWVSWRDDK